MAYPDESTHITQDPAIAEAIESELADVLQYLIRLADVLHVDLAEAVRKKALVNENDAPTYPPEAAHPCVPASSSSRNAGRRSARGAACRRGEDLTQESACAQPDRECASGVVDVATIIASTDNGVSASTQLGCLCNATRGPAYADQTSFPGQRQQSSANSLDRTYWLSVHSDGPS